MIGCLSGFSDVQRREAREETAGQLEFFAVEIAEQMPHVTGVLIVCDASEDSEKRQVGRLRNMSRGIVYRALQLLNDLTLLGCDTQTRKFVNEAYEEYMSNNGELNSTADAAKAFEQVSISNRCSESVFFLIGPTDRR
jgi:hypothetical protein